MSRTGGIEMRKNCMAEIAKALGIELEEPFCIDGERGILGLQIQA